MAPYNATPRLTVPAAFPTSATAQLPYQLIRADGPVANAPLPGPSFAHPTLPHPAPPQEKTALYAYLLPTAP